MMDCGSNVAILFHGALFLDACDQAFSTAIPGGFVDTAALGFDGAVTDAWISRSAYSGLRVRDWPI